MFKTYRIRGVFNNLDFQSIRDDHFSSLVTKAIKILVVPILSLFRHVLKWFCKHYSINFIKVPKNVVFELFDNPIVKSAVRKSLSYHTCPYDQDKQSHFDGKYGLRPTSKDAWDINHSIHVWGDIRKSRLKHAERLRFRDEQDGSSTLNWISYCQLGRKRGGWMINHSGYRLRFKEK
jgi:hypothetical protein